MTTTEHEISSSERWEKRMHEQGRVVNRIRGELDFDHLIGSSLYVPDPLKVKREPLAERGPFKISGGGVCVIYGLTQGGKSMFAVDLACTLATGAPWLGTGSVAPDKSVLYLQLEGEYEQVAERIIAWESRHGLEAGDDLTHLRTADFNWADKEVASEVKSLAEAAYADTIFIDTLDAGRLSGANMADDEIGRIFAQVLPTITDAGYRVFVIAHSNAKDDSLAGLSRQVNAVENTLHIKRRGDHRVVVLEKNKEVPGNPEIEFDIVDSSFVTAIGPVGVIEPVSEDEPGATGAGGWLVDYLDGRGGTAPSKDVKEAADAAGIGERALRNARGRLVNVKEIGGGRTVWQLREGS